MPVKSPNDSGATTQSALKEVQEVYDLLAQRPVDRACIRRKECCHFKLTGRTPMLTKGEALVAAQALRRSGRTALPASIGGACPLLQPETGNCLIYEDRPFGCRTHFCSAAGGPYQRNEVIDLIRMLEGIDHQLEGDGPHPISAAVACALDELQFRKHAR